MKYPKISIIIPTRNRSYFLRNALQSVIDQDYPNLEILVVDGDSTDDTYETVKEFITQYPFITFLQNIHKMGAPGAKNTGLEHMSGDLFATLDDDDVLIEGALKRLAEIYMNKRDYGVILGNRIRSDDHQFSGLGIQESREIKASEFWYGSLSGKFFGVIETSLLGDDRFDEDLKGGDKLFWSRIYAKTKIYYTHLPMRIYTIHSDSLTASLRFEPLVEAKTYEKEINFLETLKECHPLKSNYLATLHNRLAKLYIAGNEKIKAKEHLKKSLECKWGFEVFCVWFSYVFGRRLQ
ncbi:hypothetical protein CCZ01_04730 [Helicobacter monodelphidis]|uniref:glycosyltransferase family 2 protein n=1 Tax=Helicobacter sp. 15-1451 TaxID=2004995 RepID=UPI000DCC6B3B|nr:glycosyltransferase family 2 protein [Helicobacter sp. 15-1451]RAX57935.1 hypothetical protein CCZ01_04730 [Helicobacter sp. 15-1451]